MMHTLRNRIGSSFIGALVSMALAGVKGIVPASLRGNAEEPSPRRMVKPPKRKGYRTTKAEGVYGRNLRAHFDKHRLTRSQLKKFYAGKAI